MSFRSSRTFMLIGGVFALFIVIIGTFSLLTLEPNDPLRSTNIYIVVGFMPIILLIIRNGFKRVRNNKKLISAKARK